MKKSQALQMVAEKIAECSKCEDLSSSRISTVPGEGNANAEILFLGEAPGEDEDKSGRPFVGEAGKLLDNIISACGFKRKDLFIANILKCRPPRNRNPRQIEADNCRPFLDLQIKVIKPKYIVCMGNVASQNLLRTDEKVSYLRGRFHQHGDIKVLCTYHPSYLLRGEKEEQLSKKKAVWDDLQLLLSDFALQNSNKS